MNDLYVIYVVIVALLVLGSLKQLIPDITEAWGVDLIIFFTGGLGLSVMMHMVGYDEGKREGHEQGLNQGYDEALNGSG